jgi:hypothetical protein
VGGDVITTAKYTCSKAALERMLWRSKDLCWTVLLTGGRRPWPCPTPDEEGHCPGGRCDDLCGQDPYSLAQKKPDVGDTHLPANALVFGGQQGSKDAPCL